MALNEESINHFVSSSLAAFVKQHIPPASLECVDDIMLNYIVSILEEVGEDGDGFDVEGFTEMLGAYIPEFGQIPAEHVCTWIFALAEELTQKYKGCQSDGGGGCDPIALLASHLERSAGLQTTGTVESQPVTGPRDLDGVRSPRVSESSDASLDQTDSTCQGALCLLSEMFPAACTAELLHCLSSSDGELERTAQLLLSRQETGQSVASMSQDGARRRLHQRPRDDKSLKEQIIAKYSYQDVDEMKREHRPQPPKSSPKKLVRYLDSKVVSIKGERFTEIKRGDSDAAGGGRKGGAASCLQLKPSARQCSRFH